MPLRTRTLLALVFGAALALFGARAYLSVETLGKTLATFQARIDGDFRVSLALRRVRLLISSLDNGLRDASGVDGVAMPDRLMASRSNEAEVLGALVEVTSIDPPARVHAVAVRTRVEDWEREIAARVLDGGLEPAERAAALAESHRRLEMIRDQLDALEQDSELRRAALSAELAVRRHQMIGDWLAATAITGIVLVALWVVMVRAVEQPFAKLVAHARRVAAGDFDSIEPTGVAEARELARAASQMSAQLLADRDRQLRETALVRALAAGGDLPTLAGRALGALVEQWEADGGLLLVARADDEALDLAAAVGERGDARPGASSVAEEVRRSRATVIVDEVPSSPSVAAPTARVVAPLLDAAGGVVGVVELSGVRARGEASLAALAASLDRVALALRTLLALESTRRLARELEARRAEVVSVFETIADPILVWDARGVCRACNPAAERMFGPVIGTSIVEIARRSRGTMPDGVTPSERPEQLARAIELGVRVDRSTRAIVDASGAHRIVVYTSVPIRRDGTLAGAVGGVRDVTEEWQLEQDVAHANDELKAHNAELFAQRDRLRVQSEQLARQATELAERNEELSRASNLKSEFLASMSHELRTPLNAIIGFSEILLAAGFGRLEPKQEACVSDVLAAGRQLLSLINDVLDLSKIEAGRVEVSVVRVDLTVPIDEAIALVRASAAHKSLDVRSLVATRACVAAADPDKLRQVLVNLLSNAVKFTPDHGRVTVEAEVDERIVRVSVRDTGIGIAPDSVSKLFQPFSQVESGYSRRYAGTGLGLSICKRLVALMGGEIGVETAPGVGSRFWFTVPRASSATRPPAPPQSIVARPPSIALPDSRRPVVLLVEDQPSDAALGERALARAGYEVRLARSGEDAMAMLEHARPDFLVCDLGLPGFSGRWLVETVRATPDLEDLPIAVLTGHDLTGEEREFFGERVSFVAQKGRDSAESWIARIAEICPAPPPASSAARRAKVLVVDDSDMNRRVVAAMLESVDCEVIEAPDAETGVKLARERSPAVILMDLEMPKLDGIEATRLLAGDPTTRAIPVIAVSAHAMQSDSERAIAAGCVSYVAKPIARGVLLAAIDRALGDAAWRGEAAGP